MNNKKTLWIIIGLAILALIIIVVATSTGTKQQSTTSAPEETNVQVAPTDLDTETPIATPEEVQQAQPVIEGSSKVIDNVVVTPTGKPVKNDAVPGSPEAPQETPPIAPEALPAGTIKLDVSAEGFNPVQFEVKAGQVVTLALSSVDNITHVLLFDDPVLAGVAIGVGPNETRAITFNAPKAGEYGFHCDVPGHTARGESGKMIVK
ncbi:MAG TPA: cupredoxin domain-containing protein [Patescibacteria group bacterium]|mgnify:FL=1|jgi:plastocyanin|nr:cupredoxin domain-containing protein [bacterium]HRT11489.1 cupredoxin domain-containing protein [Patescibacteria group bacterium]